MFNDRRDKSREGGWVLKLILKMLAAWHLLNSRKWQFWAEGNRRFLGFAKPAITSLMKREMPFIIIGQAKIPEQFEHK